MGGEINDCKAEQESLRSYFQQISKYPLLSRTQEIDLSRRIKQGDDNALETLVNSNLRFVVVIAKRHLNQGLSLQDLIGEGNANLPKAAQRFDGERGYKFISYAVWWIRQGMLKAIDDQKDTIRIHYSQKRKNKIINKIINEYAISAKRIQPSVDELVEISGVNKDDVFNYFDIYGQVISLDYENDEGLSLMDAMYSHTPLPHDELLAADDGNSINLLFKRLKPREQEVLQRYFGLETGEAETLQEIGNSLHLSRERVRQIKEEAFVKILPLAKKLGYSNIV